MMADVRKIWKSGALLTVMIVMAPGGLILLQQWGYWADGTTTPAMPMSSRTIVAPEFALRDLDGTMRDLASFHGRVVLLSFWATWCLPCQTEMLSMAGLHQTHRTMALRLWRCPATCRGRGGPAVCDPTPPKSHNPAGRHGTGHALVWCHLAADHVSVGS
jgi:hypothetical protein